jgi:hypothetical protein
MKAMTTPQRRHQTDPQPATRSGTFAIGGDLPVRRLGFGAMRLTGPGVWGEPADRTEAIAVLRRAVELGINLIDTADSYGPEVAERLIAEALHPYPADLLIGPKPAFSGPAQTDGSRMVAPSICGRRSKVVSAGCVYRESICYNCTGLIRKWQWKIRSAR